jgi:protein gp37
LNKTPIEWTNYSTNPFKARHKPVDEWPCPKCGMRGTRLNVNLCTKISPGCAHCYAAALTHRWGGPDYVKKALECFEPVLDERELQRILRVKVKPGENKVFPMDMTDWAWEFWPDEFLDKFFAVVVLRPDLTFQMLTKRAERQHAYFTGKGYQARHYQVEALRMDGPEARRSDIRCEIVALGGRDGYNRIEGLKWPSPNVWLGVSAEDQRTADERIPWLLKTPAAVRWVSYEPALGPVDFLYPTTLWPDGPPRCCNGTDCACLGLPTEPPLISDMDGAHVSWIDTCAFTPGSVANLEPHNNVKAKLCVLGPLPFFCHQNIDWQNTPSRQSGLLSAKAGGVKFGRWRRRATSKRARL